MSQPPTDSAAAIAAMTMPARLRAIFGGSIGNLIEWYDFYVYNFFALYFAKSVSSPTRSPTRAVAQHIRRSTPSGFLIRPVGGFDPGQSTPTAPAARPR